LQLINKKEQFLLAFYVFILSYSHCTPTQHDWLRSYWSFMKV